MSGALPHILVLALVCAGCHSGSTVKREVAPETGPLAWPSQAVGQRGPGVPEFYVRPGYRVDLVAQDLPECRFICFDDRGRILAVMPNEGDILTLAPQSDGTFKVINKFVTGFNTAHGICFKDGWLWFAQSGAITKARDSDGDGRADQIVPVLKDLPSGGGHWWRSIDIDKGYLWTEIGDPENISDIPPGSERTWVIRYNLDGTNKTPWCSGLRNTEKMLFRPGTNDLYGCDNGSDMFGMPLGDTTHNQPITDWNPPDEFNKLEQGKFYGHPYITGDRIPRIEYQKRPDIHELADKTTVPVWKFTAHVAACGWTFISQGAKVPPDQMGDALIAEHGSYNREHKVGYAIERLLFDSATGLPYASWKLVGCLDRDGTTVLGRPVDITQGPDGNFYFSDETGKRIFKLSFTGVK